ncbi:hypothetical protein [Mucilaginibacter antarcticus]
MQQIEHDCKNGNPDGMDLIGKFEQLQAFITASTVALQQIKAEKEAAI